jgi:hypothetical protein
MKRMVLAALAGVLALPVLAADRPLTDYPEKFYVYYASGGGGCESDSMAVSEGHMAYGLMPLGFVSCTIFNPNQILQGRFVKGGRVEIIDTDAKGKQKILRYRIMWQKTF